MNLEGWEEQTEQQNFFHFSSGLWYIKFLTFSRHFKAEYSDFFVKHIEFFF